MAKVTLKQNGDIEVKAGAFCPRTVGTWKRVSVRERMGNTHELRERPLYEARLKTGGLLYGSRKELVEQIKSKV
jgi:hypothetical protein